MVPDVLIISSKVWNDLSDEEKKWLQQAADESVIEQRRLWALSEAESLEKVQEAGVEIIYPDKAPFAERVKDFKERFRDDPDLYDLINRIEAINE